MALTNKNKNKTNTINKINKSNSTKKFIRKFFIWFWGLFFAGILSFALLFLLTIYGFFGEMPNVRDLENPDIFVASEIISADGVVIQKFEKEKRIHTCFSKIV